MTLGRYLAIMSLLTAFCWGMFFFVINLVDPMATNWLGFSLFYLSLFIALVGTAAITGFFIRFVILRKELAFNVVKVSFRQSFLFSLFVVIVLVLKSHHLFNWLNLSLLIMIFTILELFLISYQKTR